MSEQDGMQSALLKTWNSLRLHLKGSSFSPLRPLGPGLASLWLGRGSGGAPFVFPSVFLPVFPPLRLVRCSRLESRAQAEVGLPFWLKLAILIRHKLDLDCLRELSKSRGNLPELLFWPSDRKLPNNFTVRVVAERPLSRSIRTLCTVAANLKRFAQTHDGRI